MSRLRILLGMFFTNTGCTLRRHPMPELREVGQELRAATAPLRRP